MTQDRPGAQARERETPSGADSTVGSRPSGGSEETPAPRPHDSVSALREFESCGVKYKLHRIDKLVLQATPPLVRGTAFHQSAAYNLRQKMTSGVDRPLREIVDVAAAAVESAFAGPIALPADDIARGFRATRGRTVDEAVRCARVYHLEAAPHARPIYVEQRIRLRPPESVYPGRDLFGIVDLATRRPSGDWPEDHKTGRAWTQADVDADHGATFYTMLHKARTRKMPAGFAVNNLVLRPGREPRYVRLETHRTMDDVRRLLLRLRAARAAIDAGVFTPTSPTSWWCSDRWCGFFRACPFGQKATR